MTSLPLLDKPCGECSECCILPSLSEMNKEQYEPCRYLNGSGKGCAIYADRPETCRKFKCLWKDDFVKGGEHYRPDKVGLLFVGSPPITKIGGQFIVAWETRPEAYDQPLARRTVTDLARTTLVLVRRYKSKKSIPVGPAQLVLLFKSAYPDYDDDPDLRSLRLNHGL